MERFVIGVLLLTVVVAKIAVRLGGAGASFPAEVYKSWMVRFRVFRAEFTDLDMNYDVIGSGRGKDNIKSDYPEHYVGSDSVLKEEDYFAHPELQMFPTMAGSVVVVFNIPNSPSINVTQAALVGIFNGSITEWDDSSIQESNPAISLPSAKIRVIVRMDRSGTTEIFTSALSSFSRTWARRYGTFSQGLNEETELPYKWNASAISFYGYTNQGVSGLIMSVKYSISYLTSSEVNSGNISFCRLQNQEGLFVEPTITSVQGAMDQLTDSFDDRFNVRLVNAAGDQSYPIAGYTYMIIKISDMTNCDAAYELFRYISWFLEDEKAKNDVERFHFVPLSEAVALKVKERVLSRISCGGQNLSKVAAQRTNQERIALQTWRLPVYIITPVMLIILALLPLSWGFRQLKLRRALMRGDWQIMVDRIKFIRDGRSISRLNFSSMGTSVSSSRSIKTDTSDKGFWVGRNPNTLPSSSTQPTIGRYQSQVVRMRRLLKAGKPNFSRDTCRQFVCLQTRIIHGNIARFFGVSLASDVWYVVQEYGSRALNDVLQNDRFNLDNTFKFTMSTDLASGLEYLHSMDIVHGNLSSASCFVDTKWTVKIMDWFFPQIANSQSTPRYWKQPTPEGDLEDDQDILSKEKFWTAPELLTGFTDVPTKESDVYSFAVVVVEVFSREDPYYNVSFGSSPKEILTDVISGKLRPKIPNDYPEGIRDITMSAFSSVIANRPTLGELRKAMKLSRPSKKGVLDCLMESIEKYMQQLEEKVEERTLELAVALKKMEHLLHQLLPPEIAMKLSNGETVQAESFEDASVFFSDIVGFTALSAESNPMDIVNLLNDLYTMFDDILDRHDVYKVETIGDGYMVSSGLPKRNGIAHAGHIATMALEMMAAAANFRIKHRPEDSLRLRIGIHSGPVCAGVVGNKTPRYCLFGDTVNTASRMESTSLAMKIQLSSSTHERLEKIGGFVYVQRGSVFAKGKGQMTTYWLHGKQGMETQVPSACTRLIDN